jgi:hypothetical protein
VDLRNKQVCKTSQSGSATLKKSRAQLLEVASAFIEVIKPLSNCSRLSEFQQLHFIKRIDIPDLTPTDIRLLEGDLFVLFRNIDTPSGLLTGRHCRAV